MRSPDHAGGQTGLERARDLLATYVSRVPAWTGEWRRPTARRVVALLLLLAALAVPSIRYRISEAWASALWGLVVTGAFVGWGAAVNRWLRPEARPDWGLDGAIGAGCYLWGAGALAVVHAVSKGMLWTILLLGLVALFASDRSDRPRGRWPSVTFGIAVGAVLALALLRYAESVSNLTFNVWDDNMAYRQFAQKLLETGSLYEPFSSRRLASLGGQTMLDVAVLAGAPSVRLHLVDSGICVLLVVGLLLGYGASPARRAAGLLAAVLFITIPDPRHNIGSEVSGLLFFLAMFRLCDAWRFKRGRPWGDAVLIGLVGAAACTLRQSYFPAVGFMLAAVWVMRFMARPPQDRRVSWQEATQLVVSMFVAMLPWMLTSFANARTFLYPVMTGDSNPDWGLLGRVDGWEEDRWFLINEFYFEPVRSIVLFVIAGCLLPSRRRTIAVRGLLIGTLIGFAMLVHSLRASVYFDSVERYYFAFAGAFCCALTLRALSVRGPAVLRNWVPAALVIAAIGLHILENREELQKTYTAWVNGAQLLQKTINPGKHAADEGKRFYARIQGVVPPHARLVVMVDHPYLFDFRRNEILNFDQPGAVSPKPHVPYFKGPDALARYWLNMGIRYIVFGIGASPEYNYDLWRGRLAEQVKPGDRGGMYKSIARYYLDAFDSLMALTKTRKILFHEGDVWALDLAARP